MNPTERHSTDLNESKLNLLTFFNIVMKYTLHLKNTPITDEELKSDVIRVANLIAPEPLSSKKYNELGKYNNTVFRRFGNRRWNDALTALGLELVQVFHSEKDLFDNIGNVWLAKMEQPVRRDMDEHPSSKISSGAYLRKYGKWNIALQKFIEYVENGGEITLPESGTNFAARHRTPRIPNNRLKVKVLMRDGNKCKVCGVRCDEGLHKLHFDHIIPWSQGGETTYENLRVLCKACNEALGNTNEIPND